VQGVMLPRLAPGEGETVTREGDAGGTVQGLSGSGDAGTLSPHI
jgi:hypothetical protein